MLKKLVLFVSCFLFSYITYCPAQIVKKEIDRSWNLKNTKIDSAWVDTSYNSSSFIDQGRIKIILTPKYTLVDVFYPADTIKAEKNKEGRYYVEYNPGLMYYLDIDGVKFELFPVETIDDHTIKVFRRWYSPGEEQGVYKICTLYTGLKLTGRPAWLSYLTGLDPVKIKVYVRQDQTSELPYDFELELTTKNHLHRIANFNSP